MIGKGLQRRPALCAVAVVGPGGVVVGDEGVQVGLQRLDRVVMLPAVSGAEAFVLQRAVDALHHPVGLRRADLRGTVLDLLDEVIEREGMVQGPAAVLASVVGENAVQRDAPRVREGQDAVVEQVHRRHGQLAQVQLREGDGAVGIDEVLRVDPPDPFERADEVGVDAPGIAGVRRLEVGLRVERFPLVLGQQLPDLLREWPARRRGLLLQPQQAIEALAQPPP